MRQCIGIKRHHISPSHTVHHYHYLFMFAISCHPATHQSLHSFPSLCYIPTSHSLQIGQRPPPPHIHITYTPLSSLLTPSHLPVSYPNFTVLLFIQQSSYSKSFSLLLCIQPCNHHPLTVISNFDFPCLSLQPSFALHQFIIRQLIRQLTKHALLTKNSHSAFKDNKI